MNHVVYCFQIGIPTRRFRAHYKVVSRNRKESFQKLGISKYLVRILSYISNFMVQLSPCEMRLKAHLEGVHRHNFFYIKT